MRGTIIAALVIALAAVLMATNPDKSAFARAYADRLNAEVAGQLGLGGALGDLIGGVTQRAIATAVEEQTIHHDYVVASVFVVPSTGDDLLRVLGIMGQFVRLGGGEGV